MMRVAERNSVCLTMIVRDEAHVIRRCLRSVKPHIDSWVIADTGSTDDTVAVIEDELRGIPGRIRRDKWVDFSTNRNLAIEDARGFGTEYLLTLDADEELRMPTGAQFAGLDADSYAARFHLDDTDSEWRRQILFKSDIGWRFEGVIHERLVCPKRDTLNLPFENVHVMSHHDSARNQDKVAKYRKDADVLKREVRKNPGDKRSWFYLGMTLAGAQKIDAAIDAYRQRIALGANDHDEEVYYSQVQIAALMEFRGDDWRDVAAAYVKAYNFRPTRGEPLWAAAALHGARREFAIAELYCRRAASMPVPKDAMMVQTSVYSWRAAHDLAGYLAEQGKLDEAKGILQKLIGLPQLPKEQRPTVEANIRLIEAAA